MPFGAGFQPVEVPLVHAALGRCTAILRPATLTDAHVWSKTWEQILRKHSRYDSQFPWASEIARAESAPGSLVLALARGPVIDGLLSLRLRKSESRHASHEDLLY